MDKQQKEEIAIFRFGVIFPLLEIDPHRYWGEKERLLKDLVNKEWDIPHSKRNYISKPTILSWLRKYEIGGRKIEALYPQARTDKGRLRTIDDATIDALVRIRKENPRLSVPRIMEIALQQGVLTTENRTSPATIYRLMKKHKIQTEAKNQDLRKFEVQMTNDLWQSDCMHGPDVVVGNKKQKTYLFAFIDDHSRLIPHGQFYLAETLENYLNCFWTALRKRGIPRKLYVDNGPSFRSHRLQLGCASLAIGLSYAKPYKPQGKGKIERFFRTVRSQFLSELSIGMTLEDLNQKFFQYVDETYHVRIHGTTGQTPLDRYIQDAKALRKAPDHLPDHFRKQEIRRVNNDRTIKLDNRLFEAPSGLVGQQVTLRFETYDRIEVFVDEQSKGFLTILNQEINSRVKRGPSSDHVVYISKGQLFQNLARKEAHNG